MDSKFLIKFCFMLLKIKSINETSFNKSGWYYNQSLHQFTMTSTLHLFNYQNSKLFFKTIQQMRFRTQLGCRPIVRVQGTSARRLMPNVAISNFSFSFFYVCSFMSVFMYLRLSQRFEILAMHSQPQYLPACMVL